MNGDLSDEPGDVAGEGAAGGEGGQTFRDQPRAKREADGEVLRSNSPSLESQASNWSRPSSPVTEAIPPVFVGDPVGSRAGQPRVVRNRDRDPSNPESRAIPPIPGLHPTPRPSGDDLAQRTDRLTQGIRMGLEGLHLALGDFGPLARELRELTRQAVERQEVGELRAEVQSLKQEVQELRRLQEQLLGRVVGEALDSVVEGSGSVEEPPPDSLPGLEILYNVGRALGNLLVQLGADAPDEFRRRQEALEDLRKEFDQERLLEERAGLLLDLLRQRLLAGGDRDRLRQQQARLVFQDVPDLILRADELAPRLSDPEQRQAMEAFTRTLMDLLDLEEVHPHRGDPFDRQVHNLLKADTEGGPDMENKVAHCYSRGLLRRSTRELVRKADVSVFL